MAKSTPKKAPKTKAAPPKSKAAAKPAPKAKGAAKPAAKVVKPVKVAKPKATKPSGGKSKTPAKPAPKPLVAPKPLKAKVVEEPENAAFGATKIERTILEAIRTAKLGLPDWPAVAKAEHISLDYLNNRVEWMRRMDMI